MNNQMKLSQKLGVQARDIISVVGCGGKTSLIKRLAIENAGAGVLICPTTQITTAEMVIHSDITYMGCLKGDKLHAASLEEIHERSHSFPITLLEADGSKGLSLKGWASYEPVIPAYTTLTIGVVSVQATGLSANPNNVHRLPLFLEQVGMKAGGAVDEAAIARMILYCIQNYGKGRKAILINQADHDGWYAQAYRIADNLKGFPGNILIGSLREEQAWRRV